VWGGGGGGVGDRDKRRLLTDRLDATAAVDRILHNRLEPRATPGRAQAPGRASRPPTRLARWWQRRRRPHAGRAARALQRGAAKRLVEQLRPRHRHRCGRLCQQHRRRGGGASCDGGGCAAKGIVAKPVLECRHCGGRRHRRRGGCSTPGAVVVGKRVARTGGCGRCWRRGRRAPDRGIVGQRGHIQRGHPCTHGGGRRGWGGSGGGWSGGGSGSWECHERGSGLLGTPRPRRASTPHGYRRRCRVAGRGHGRLCRDGRLGCHRRRYRWSLRLGRGRHRRLGAIDVDLPVHAAGPHECHHLHGSRAAR
jgi:hypothetical protein